MARMTANTKILLGIAVALVSIHALMTAFGGSLATSLGGIIGVQVTQAIVAIAGLAGLYVASQELGVI